MLQIFIGGWSLHTGVHNSYLTTMLLYDPFQQRESKAAKTISV